VCAIEEEREGEHEESTGVCASEEEREGEHEERTGVCASQEEREREREGTSGVCANEDDASRLCLKNSPGGGGLIQMRKWSGTKIVAVPRLMWHDQLTQNSGMTHCGEQVKKTSETRAASGHDQEPTEREYVEHETRRREHAERESKLTDRIYRS
jgi:hypothetical protein